MARHVRERSVTGREKRCWRECGSKYGLAQRRPEVRAPSRSNPRLGGAGFGSDGGGRDGASRGRAGRSDSARVEVRRADLPHADIDTEGAGRGAAVRAAHRSNIGVVATDGDPHVAIVCRPCMRGIVAPGCLIPALRAIPPRIDWANSLRKTTSPGRVVTRAHPPRHRERARCRQAEIS